MGATLTFTITITYPEVCSSTSDESSLSLFFNLTLKSTQCCRVEVTGCDSSAYGLMLQEMSKQEWKVCLRWVFSWLARNISVGSRYVLLSCIYLTSESWFCLCRYYSNKKSPCSGQFLSALPNHLTGIVYHFSSETYKPHPLKLVINFEM